MLSDTRHNRGMSETGVPRSGEPATQVVVRHLERLILDGGLVAGDPLPSETQLASELGLSRLTIREGVRTLVARGLLDVSKGRRPVVSPANAGPLRAFFASEVRRDARGRFELLEVRFALEVAAASLAARAATKAERDALALALERMRVAGEDHDAYNDADLHFHALIASASGNRMITFLMEGMEEPLSDSRAESLRGHLARGESIEDLLEQHAAILRAIVARDARAAGAAMRRHLVQTRADLRAALA